MPDGALWLPGAELQEQGEPWAHQRRGWAAQPPPGCAAYLSLVPPPPQVPFYGVNLSVGLSVQLAGFGLQVAQGLLGELPYGAVSLVGVKRCACASMRMAVSRASASACCGPGRPPAIAAPPAVVVQVVRRGTSPVPGPAPAPCSVEEARRARLAGADALLIKAELVRQHVGDLGRLVEALRDATNLDD